MSTPPTQGDYKSVRVSPEIHERLQRLSAGLNNANMNDTIAWLLSPSMVRVNLTPEQLERWKRSAQATGQNINAFVESRVEAALMYGADPGTLRRVHDMVYSLTRVAGIIPQAAGPGRDEQVISARPGPNQQ
jgi:hypothetical protein